MMDEADLRSRVARLSVAQKVRLLTGADFWALYPEPDVGLRRVVPSELLLGSLRGRRLRQYGR